MQLCCFRQAPRLLLAVTQRRPVLTPRLRAAWSGRMYAYMLNSRSEEKNIRNTSIFGPRLEYVFRNTCGIRPEYCEYEQNTAPWEVVWNTWNTYSTCRVHVRTCYLSIRSVCCSKRSAMAHAWLIVELYRAPVALLFSIQTRYQEPTPRLPVYESIGACAGRGLHIPQP